MSAECHSLKPYIILDTCVLISSVLKPLFIRLHQLGVCHLISSHDIKTEWVRNASRLWQQEPSSLEAEWQEFERLIPSLIEDNLQPYIQVLRHSDRKDFHVIAAAMACKARRCLHPDQLVAVVTWNLKDFNKAELKRAGITLFSPDKVLSLWWQQSPELILEALSKVPDDVAQVGKYAPEPLSVTLKRERLHILNKALAT